MINANFPLLRIPLIKSIDFFCPRVIFSPCIYFTYIAWDLVSFNFRDDINCTLFRIGFRTELTGGLFVIAAEAFSKNPGQSYEPSGSHINSLRAKRNEIPRRSTCRPRALRIDARRCDVGLKRGREARALTMRKSEKSVLRGQDPRGGVEKLNVRKLSAVPLVRDPARPFHPSCSERTIRSVDDDAKLRR